MILFLTIAILALAAGVGLLGYLSATVPPPPSSPPPGLPDFVNLNVQRLAGAMGKAEGYGVPGAIPTRANNPGDLAEGDQGLGVLGPSHITIFADIQTGWNRLYAEIYRIYHGQSGEHSLSDTFEKFAGDWVDGPLAPGYSQGAQNWLQAVTGTLGVDPQVTLGGYLNASG